MTVPTTVRIYIAPYHAAKEDSPSTPCGSPIVAFRKTVALGDWPYDYGDDPSFYAMRKFKAPLSWGVCRPDVRNQLCTGHIVVFFSYAKYKDTGDSEYSLCALATVERTVSQTQLWENPKLRKFTKYFNLLIKPQGPARGCWRHFEPTLQGDKARIHGDWLWRISDHQGLRKRHFEKLEATNRFGPRDTIGGVPLAVARNYVIFSDDPAKTHVLANPPIVARHSGGKAAEEWEPNRFSGRVKELTLDSANAANGGKRWLRIRNSQRAHRHIVFELPVAEAENWRSEFLRLIRLR